MTQKSQKLVLKSLTHIKPCYFYNVMSFSLFSYVRHKNLFENAGPGDKWFSLKSLKITRTVINYPDLNYAYPTVSKIMSYTQELLNMFVTFAVLI